MAQPRPAERMTDTALFALHYPRLAGWVRRLVDDDETAHEIAAEAFTRVLSRLRHVDDPRAYVYAAASNLVRDHWRSLERQRRAYARSATVEQVEQPPDVEVRALVQALPERLRVIVLLHYYADLTVSDISRVTGRPAGTIKRQLSEARTALAAQIGCET